MIGITFVKNLLGTVVLWSNGSCIGLGVLDWEVGGSNPSKSVCLPDCRLDLPILLNETNHGRVTD